MAEHVPFVHGDVASYGTYSALFGWRTDIQDYIRHPFDRRDSIDWYTKNVTAQKILFGNPESHGDMCAFGVEALGSCDKVEASTDPAHDGLKRQCKELRDSAANRPDFTTLMRQEPLPDFMRHTRDLVRAQLRELPWPQPAVVVLMPVPRLWKRDVLGPGLHEWARAILQPLADEGRIRLIDATDLFDADDAECSLFFDFYHQNAAGRDRLMRWLMPQIEALLYARTATDTPAGAAMPERSGKSAP